MGAVKSVNVKKIEKRLEAEREEILGLVHATEDDRKPVQLDQAQVGRLSRMDALQVQEMALETERRREVELQRIDAALKRIEEGDYGLCTACGEEIAAKRLEFDPPAPLCVSCAGANG